MQVTRSISIPANSTVNVLEADGVRLRFIDINVQVADIELYSTGSATGLEQSLFVGSDNPIEKSIVNTQNRFPVIPDDLVNTEEIEGEGGEQLQLNIENTTAGALTYFYTLVVAALA